VWRSGALRYLIERLNVRAVERRSSQADAGVVHHGRQPAPVLDGQGAGYLQRNGLDVTTRTVPGGANTTATMLSGEVQVVAGGGTEALSAVSNGADLVIAATTGPKFEYIFEVPRRFWSSAFPAAPSAPSPP
jgi:hypothetical protein